MANYEATARSNYFRVKDRGTFDAWCALMGIRIVEKDTDPDLLAMIFEEDIPSDRYDEEADEHEPIDFYQELASHLVDGQIAVVVEIGHEKTRYLVGFAVAVNSAGETRTITLDSIYDVATELLSATSDPIISRATY